MAFGVDVATADRTVFYTAAFPTSYFFSLPLSESLFLLLTVGSFYAAKRDSWWIAGILGALASATRLSGLVLIPGLLVLQWQSTRSLRPNAKTLSLLLIPLGVLSFMVHLHFVTGNAFAFVDVMPAWGRYPQFFVRTLLEYAGDPLEFSFKWNFKLLNFAIAILALSCGVVMLKWRQWSLGVYTLLSALLPLSSSTLQSMDRYMMVVFPIFMVLGTAGRSGKVDQSLRAVFLVLLGVLTTLCTVIVTLALS